jgi:tetratricopeptide (TPR) repeat protein
MDRKKGAAGSLSLGYVVTQVLPVPLFMVLVLLLALLPACKPQGSSPRKFSQQIRPATNTDRLVQNAAYLKKSGRVELAVKELEEAHLQEPENLELLDILIQCYEELGHFDRAQELYEEALSRAGHHPALENNRCYSLYLQGRLGQAESCFRKVLAGQPENQAARNNLGLVLVRQGRETEALAMWREALSDAEARQRLGKALAALGKEVPPSLADSLPPTAEQQAAASDNSAASSPSVVPQRHGPLTQLPGYEQRQPPLQAKATSSPPLSSQADTVSHTPGSPDLPSSSPVEQSVSKSVPAPPEKAGVSTHAHKEPPAAPAAISRSKKKKAITSPKLTALELHGTQIELQNGNGIQDRARELRSLLFLEGFTVVGIGNHIDFGLEETIISYRPEAKRVAQVLSQKYFPGAKLQEGGKVSQLADIRVSLGRDRLADLGIIRVHLATYAESGIDPFPGSGTVATNPPEKVIQAEAAHSPANPPAYLTAQELNQVRIELKNGTGIYHQAREWRSRLFLEGFTVVDIGNHVDFGLKETVISYRPEAKRVAQVLAQKFFPGAKLEEDIMPSVISDVRVALGRDLIVGQEQLALVGP